MNTVKPSGLRVVFDTNIYFSAFTHPRGQPFRIWQRAIERQYTLLVSPAIIRELARVLRDRAHWAEPEVIRQLKLIAKIAEIVSPEITLRAVAEDESDNRILECAVAGSADLIVTGDQHIRRLKTFRGIGIVRAVDFLRVLGRIPYR